MQGQLQDIETQAGPCSDCGTVVPHRMACLDATTHSIVELCDGCWYASRQRQVFSGGCCG